MAWKTEYSQIAGKQLLKLPKIEQRRINAFLKDRIETSADPRSLGRALQGEKKGLWRYRVGDYRLICDIQDGVLIVLVLSLGHRKDVYR